MFLFNLSKKIHDFDLKIRSPYHMRLCGSFGTGCISSACTPAVETVEVHGHRLLLPAFTAQSAMLIAFDILPYTVQHDYCLLSVSVVTPQLFLFLSRYFQGLEFDTRCRLL